MTNEEQVAALLARIDRLMEKAMVRKAVGNRVKEVREIEERIEYLEKHLSKPATTRKSEDGQDDLDAKSETLWPSLEGVTG